MNAYELADYLDYKLENVFPHHQDTIDMLRQQADRIAELEKTQKTLINDRNRHLNHAKELLKEKQSEPVAWMYQNASGEMKMLGNTRLEEWVTKYGCKEIPLYATPQTKPLSDEEIWEMWNINGIGVPYEFARAIEAKVRGENIDRK